MGDSCLDVLTRAQARTSQRGQVKASEALTPALIIVAQESSLKTFDGREKSLLRHATKHVLPQCMCSHNRSSIM